MTNENRTASRNMGRKRGFNELMEFALNALGMGSYLRTAKYIIAGGIAALVQLTILYILTDIFRLWYLSSATLAFTCAFMVSFLLQKFWTFEDADRTAASRQLALYLTVALTNLVINAFSLYVLVDMLGIYYMLGQIITSGTIALYSFFVYGLIIFNRVEPKTEKNL